MAVSTSDNYVISDKYTKIEFENLHNFVLSLVIKNEDLADKYETIHTSRKAFEFLDAFFINKTYVNETVRKEIIEKYVEENDYYKNLFKDHGIDIAQARISRDYSILKYSYSYLDEKEISIFLEIYSSTLTYFFKVLYTPAFKAHEFNREFITILLVFITMERYINRRMELGLDIDFYNEYQLKNMFLSFGLDIIEDLPIKYQRRLLKNLNTLLSNKGTNKAIISIVNLFGFENVQLMKFYLVKVFEKNPYTNKISWDLPDIKFAKIPIEEVNIESFLQKSTLFDYEGITSGDPFWQASKTEIISKSFNYLETKYLGLEVSTSMLKEVIELSYFLNTLKYLEWKCKNDPNFYGKDDLLRVLNVEYSMEPIKVYDLVLSLNYLILKMNGFVDWVTLDSSSVQAVYGYNFNDFYKYAVENFDGDGIKNFDEISNQFTDEKITKDNFVNTFIFNQDYRTAFENEMAKTKNYKKFKEMKNLWKLKFTINHSNDELYGYEKYSDYLMESNPEFFSKLVPPENIEESERLRFYNNHINLITTILDFYLDSDKLEFFLKNSIFTYETIKRYISNLIRTFKSYTIDLKDINIIYLADNKLFNTVKLFEEDYWYIDIKTSEFIEYKDKTINKTEMINMDDFEYIDYYIETVFVKFINKINYEGILDKFLVNLRDKEFFTMFYEWTMTHSLSFGEFNEETFYNDFYYLLVKLLYKDQITGRDEVERILSRFSESELVNIKDELKSFFTYMKSNEKLQDYLKEKLILENFIQIFSRLDYEDKYYFRILHQLPAYLELKTYQEVFDCFFKMKDNLNLKHFITRNISYIQKNYMYIFENYVESVHTLLEILIEYKEVVKQNNNEKLYSILEMVDDTSKWLVFVQYLNELDVRDSELNLDIEVTHTELYNITCKVGKFLAHNLMNDSIKGNITDKYFITTILGYYDMLPIAHLFKILDTTLSFKESRIYFDRYILTVMLEYDDYQKFKFNETLKILDVIMDLKSFLNYKDILAPLNRLYPGASSMNLQNVGISRLNKKVNDRLDSTLRDKFTITVYEDEEESEE